MLNFVSKMSTVKSRWPIKWSVSPIIALDIYLYTIPQAWVDRKWEFCYSKKWIKSKTKRFPQQDFWHCWLSLHNVFDKRRGSDSVNNLINHYQEKLLKEGHKINSLSQLLSLEWLLISSYMYYPQKSIILFWTTKNLITCYQEKLLNLKENSIDIGQFSFV